MEDFEIIEENDILYQIFLEWENDPEFYNSRLYLSFLKYKKSWPNSEELEKWKQKIFLENLKKVNTIEDLDNTLDGMDEINNLCQKLDEFSKLVLQEKISQELKSDWEFDSFQLNSNVSYNYPPIPTTYPFIKTLQIWFQSIIDWSQEYIIYFLDDS